MKNKRLVLLVVPVLFLLLSGITTAREEKPHILALTGARLIDGNGGTPLDDAVIIIEGGKFSQVGPRNRVAIPKGAEILDIQGKTVVPGLIDAHMHFAWPQSLPPGVALTEAYSALSAEDLLNRCLMAGITTARDVGGYGFVTISAKHAFEAGFFHGSRPIVCGQGITCTGGHGAESGQGGVMEADGADGFRKAVRSQITAGADIIKILCPFSREEILAAIEETHLQEKFVAVHACLFKAQYDFLRWTVEGGADCIEHAYAIPDDVIPQIAEKKIYCVPTMAILLMAGDDYAKRGPDWAWKVIKYRECREIFRKLKQAGVRMAVGTDAMGGYMAQYPELFFKETDLFVAEGCTPMETIVAATKIGAEVCDAADRLGTIEKGKIADLLVLEKDPLADIKNLRSARIIIQGGKIIQR